MAEPLAVDGSGNVLAAFHPGGGPFEPLTAALVALWHGARLLLVFDRYKRCWELPGGGIEPGETPRRAAVRELREETGIGVDDLVFAGYARFVLGPERRVEYAAVYTRELAVEPTGFEPNEEIAAIRWWDGEPDPLVAPLDVALARLAGRSTSRP